VEGAALKVSRYVKGEVLYTDVREMRVNAQTPRVQNTERSNIKTTEREALLKQNRCSKKSLTLG
jgi:hypothetical protein